MAAKRRDRAVEELYNAMKIIMEPEITPVMKGSYRMQGPVDETDYSMENMAAQPGSEFGKPSMCQKIPMKVESGTCNVCSAPCSSCMHLNRAHMGSKAGEFSDDTCNLSVPSQYSINESEILPTLKGKSRKTFDSLQLATSETSNILSINSTHDSSSENAESKATVRSSNLSDCLEDVEMLPKTFSGGTGKPGNPTSYPQCASDQRIFSDKYADSKSVEGHDDNISCVSRVNNANVAVSYSNRNIDAEHISRTSTSACSFDPKRSGRAVIPPKLDSSEVPTSKEIETGNVSAKVQCPYSHSQSGHLVEDNSKTSMKIYTKSEAETDKDRSDSPDIDDPDEKPNELVELPNMRGTTLQAVSEDEGDDSDIVEHDVKVCDICGDAGREDLLAICCRCSDGAEHTYCMREMLQKVPEGDWLCEECKFTEEAEIVKRGSDPEEKRTNKGWSGAQSSGKRLGGNMEAVPAAKRQNIETNIGSPKASSPSRPATFSRDSSFKSLDRDGSSKSLDKGKIVPVPFVNHSGNDSLENPRATGGPRLQTPKSSFLKSNSFNTSNSKPKVKLVEDVPQRQKGAREYVSIGIKEGIGRTMVKSKSFKSGSIGRPSTGESKVKMLSPNFSHDQDIRRPKQVKEQSVFERKNLSKLDRPMAATSAVPTPLVDQKLTSPDESTTPSASKYRDLKGTPPDGKSSTLPRSTSSLVRKGPEVPLASVEGSSGNSSEQRWNQVSPREEQSFSSTAERPSNVSSGVLQEGLPRSIEDQDEKKETSLGRSKPALSVGLRGVLCQKCKEIGHAADHCPLGSPQPSGIDAPAAKNTREEMYKGNKLKAAIEAAMRMRPGLSERTSHDQQSLVSSTTKSIVSVEGKDEGQANNWTSSSDFDKKNNANSLKQPTANPTDVSFSLKAGDSDSAVPAWGKPRLRDLPGHTLAATSNLLKKPAVPEHEYIWQGDFEVHRDGKLQDSCGGFQAHLSTGASSKVLEVVNTLPPKIPLNEVARLSTWPLQFHDSGAKEDHIALYFFAKDLESYEKNYRGLLDSMMKNDLALRGNLDDVEIMIFPSNQLPENCQRWNMLFFLWGVFRGRRSDCIKSLRNSCFSGSNAVSLDKDPSFHVEVLSKNLDLFKQIDKEPSSGDSSCNVVVASDAPGMMCIKVNEDGDSKSCSQKQMSLGLEENSDQQDRGPDLKYSSAIAASRERLYPETRCTSASLEKHSIPECRLNTESKTSHSAAGANCGSSKGILGSNSKEIMPNRLNSQGDQVNLERSMKGEDGYIDKQTTMAKDKIMEEHYRWPSNHRKRPALDLTKAAPPTSGDASSEVPWSKGDNAFLDGESVSKKMRAGYRCSSSERVSSSEGVASQMYDLGPCSLIEEKKCDEVCDEKVIPEDFGATERYFFPVDMRPVRDIRLGDNSMPLKELSSEDGDRFHGVPNLELALGADTKISNKGMLPFFVGTVDKSNNQDKPSHKEEEEEDGSASLSLSLSFPFPKKEQTVKPPLSKTEQPLPERHNVNTSLLLFGGFPDK